MGQIVSGVAKPKRCNLQSLSQLGTPAAGEHILVSSDNSMNAAGQGNFDAYIVGDGVTAATALELKNVETLIGVFDISSYHATGGVLVKYADLTAALNDGNNIPQSSRKGGMSVKFVQSSDNRYVQYRLSASNWSTDIHNWTSEDPYFIDKIMQEVNEAIDENTPIEIHGDVTNAPDEEDLTSVNVGGTDVLKFKDKAYNPLTYSGLGRVILRKNIVNGVNTLTQDMFYKGEVGSRIPNTDTIFVIQYDYDLGGESVTIPVNCVLEFNGGSLSNGTIVGQNTVINAGLVKIFDSITLEGTWISNEAYLEWYGELEDYATAVENLKVMPIVLQCRTYHISNITLGRGTSLSGKGRHLSILKQVEGATGDMITLHNWAQSNMHDLRIEGAEVAYAQDGCYEQALVKWRTTESYYGSWRSQFYNITIYNSRFNGLSILGYAPWPSHHDSGYETWWNWIFHVHNIFIQKCDRYCLYNRSSDNLFSNINIGGGGRAGFIDFGSSNQFVNMKIDSNAGSDATEDIQGSLDTSSGAGMYLASGLSNYVNIDIQSCSVCGLKIIGAFNITFKGSINNCANSNEAQLNPYYSPALYIKNARNCDLSIVAMDNDKQIITFKDGLSNFGNSLNIIDSKNNLASNYIYNKDYNTFSVNNKVSIPNFIDAHKNKNVFRRAYNMLKGNDGFDISEGGANSLIVRGEKGCVVHNNTSSIQANSSGIVRVRKGHLYLLCFVFKCVSKSGDLVDNKNVPYFNFSSNQDIKTATLPIKLSLIQQGEIYLSATCLCPINDTDLNIRIYCVPNNLATYYLSIPRMYDLKDLGMTGYNPELVGTYAKLAADLVLPYIDITPTEIAPYNPINYFSGIDVPAYWQNDNVIAHGTFANRPSAANIDIGYRYFCTDKQTTEGATDGIEIIYKGLDTTDPENPVEVWVDALGRVVS